MNYANVLIDLSESNEKVDFELAKKDKILCIIHRATIGCSELRTKGEQNDKIEDIKYAERAKSAAEQGFLWGAYHYGLGGSGARQATHFLNTTAAIGRPDIRLALNIEETKGHGNQMMLSDAKDFVVEVHRQTGSWPIIYGGRFLRELADLTSKSILKTLSNCPLWVPRWNAESTIVLPQNWSRWTFWQYTNGEKGIAPHEVQGIGPCNRSKFNGTAEALKTFWTTPT